jgi:hypothetical protein
MEHDPSAYARQKANGPALALTIVGWISVGVMILSVGFNIYLLTSGQGRRVPARFNLPGETVVAIRACTGIVFLAVHAWVLSGAIRMRQLRGYKRAKAACIVAVIPCLSPCYLIGIPFGIWGLVALNDPAVRDGFES